ncbi:MAG: glycine cleavage system protein GcvH [Phycisphaerae bacterium]|nr:glycine cleavage system protein GcvH [Phycisphaerae bacterium]
MSPKDLRYTEQHEWVRVEGNAATVGITDHAQQALGDITFVELPDTGQQVEAGGEVCAIESAKAASSIYAPAAGKVAEANSALEDDPSTVNTDPYGDGWVYKLELSDPSQLETLMDAEAYDAFLEKDQGGS